jgi:hypothetical protein
VIAVLDNPNDYTAYRDDPAHVAVLRDYIAPIISEAARIQFECAGEGSPRTQGS